MSPLPLSQMVCLNISYRVLNFVEIFLAVLICETIPVNGRINITWHLQTGNSPIVAINISYVRSDGIRNLTLSGPDVSIDAFTAVSSVLVANYTYIPVVSVTYKNGSTTIIVCPARFLNYGKYVIKGSPTSGNPTTSYQSGTEI